MIGRLMDRLAGRVAAADVVRTTDETLGVTVAGDGWPEVRSSDSVGWHVRVQRDGRVGLAGAVDDQVDALADRALASARWGPALTVHLPAPAPFAEVRTFGAATRALGPADLAELSRRLAERLARPDRSVSTWAERSSGRVQVANTRGVMAAYDLTMVGVGVRATPRNGAPRCDLHWAGVDPPTVADLDRLVEEVEACLSGGPVFDGTTPAMVAVGLAPRAVASLVMALGRTLVPGTGLRLGEPGPMPGGERPGLSSRLTLVDDPLLDGRPGSRPFDDDGVASRRLVLVEDGVICGWRADLMTGARTGLPSTGHGARRAFAPPAIGPSNSVLMGGDAPDDDLDSLVGDGVVVLDLPDATRRPGAGHLSLTTPWARRVVNGRTAGRLERLTIQGNLFELLRKVRAVGRTVEWIGSVGAPALVLDGVTVTTTG